ncbi:unnamed protein product [Periconia digitata]|uniref:Gated mechanosensitive channel n=1 Tax=Periconia digitata TaxID=1303443 RepID=A0A9W4UU53_9PLEO|nr:unnamed protein product [Periconia digitata]
MPRLDDNTPQYLRDAEQGVRAHTRRAWESFTDFALRDNVLEVAVGLILAQSFTTLTTSLVTDILLPTISLLPFLSRNLPERFTTLRAGPQYNTTLTSGYNTPSQALADGAVIFAWGNFVDKLVRFLVVAVVLWVIATGYSRGSGEDIVKRQVRCGYCRKWVGEKARRCFFCTSWLDGREEKGGERVEGEGEVEL